MTYHRVNPVLWDDEKFVELDDLAGRLWLLLLTGPQRTALPGLQRGSVASLADTLRRPVDVVAKALQSLVDAGMVHVDDRRRVIWIPNAPKHNPAESPNHLRAWWNRWNEIPDCDLKFRHIERLKDYAVLGKPEHSKVWATTFGAVKLVYCEPSPGASEALRKPLESPSEALPKYVTVSVTADVTGRGDAPARDPGAPCPMRQEEPKLPPPLEPSVLPEPEASPPRRLPAPPAASCTTVEPLFPFAPDEALDALQKSSDGRLPAMASAPQLRDLGEIIRTAKPRPLALSDFEAFGRAYAAGKALAWCKDPPDLGLLLRNGAAHLMTGIQEGLKWERAQRQRAVPVRIVPAPDSERREVTPEELREACAKWNAIKAQHAAG